MLRGTSDYETELNEGLIDWSNDQGNPDGTIALGNGTLAFQDATGGISAYTPAMWIAEGTTGYSCDSAMANCIQLGPQASIECGPSGVGDCFCECDELWDCASMILYDCEKHLAYWPDSGTFTCNHDGEC